MVGRIVKDSFKYLNQDRSKKDSRFQQKGYIVNLEQVEISAVNTKEKLDEYGLSILRHGTGKLNWVGQGTRLELCSGWRN